MVTSAMSRFLDSLSTAVLLREGEGVADGRLMDAFITRGEDAAFAALVRRHGPMVWGVCRRLLAGDADAEDAFQATFLILVRKAPSIVPRDLVANWLYGVACNVCRKARATTGRRRMRERQVVTMPEPEALERDLWGYLEPLLDQELSRLPDKYRAAIVLCDLEGMTRKEAARQLGIPEGTLSSRLATGRAMLAKRLARHGLAMSGVGLGTVLSQQVASAVVPPSVVSSTIKAASVYAAGQAAAAGVISCKVAALTEGVLKTMFLTKLKGVMARLLVVLACVGGGTVVFLPPAVGQPPAAEKKDGNAKAAADERQRKETDKDKLQGQWEIQSVAGEGKVFKKADKPDGLKGTDLNDVVIEGDRLRPTKAEEIKSCWHGKITLDESRDPKQITIQDEWLVGKLTFRGIYAIEGDVFKMCLNSDGTDVCRPEEFVTRKGSPVFIVTFKKVPPRK